MTEKRFVIDNEKLILEWDWNKNNSLGLFPDKITCGSGRKVWWTCSNKHLFEARVADRSTGQGCPFCSGKKVLYGYNDLETWSIKNNRFDLINEFDIVKNNFSLKEITKGSGKKAWWKCSKGHSWLSRIDHRVSGSKCIYCTNQKAAQGENDLATLCPNIIDEWDYRKNNGLNPTNFKLNSNKKVWWKCALGHSWQATIKHRTSGTRCPKCYKEYGTSFAEQCICYYLSQCTKVENRIKINGFEVDIFLTDYNIGFEYDGSHYHSSGESAHKDKIKDDFFNNSQIKLYRIKESTKNEFDINNKTIYCIPNNNYVYIKYVLLQIEKILNCKIPEIDIFNDSIKIYNQYIKSIKDNSIANTNIKLSKEWDYAKNGNLLPENFTAGSNKKVWWVCLKCKSSYLANISHRSSGTACPYCSGKKVNNTNSLKNVYPQLDKMWDYDNNVNVKPGNIYFNSSKKVWWKCPICEKAFTRSICLMNKSKTLACKECMHKIIGLKNQKLSVIKNGNLEDSYPDIIKEWNYEKNKELHPKQFSSHSGKKVWWKCKKCGFEWESTINNRTNGTGCPKCNKK